MRGKWTTTKRRCMRGDVLVVSVMPLRSSRQMVSGKQQCSPLSEMTKVVKGGMSSVVLVACVAIGALKVVGA
jgi:hypothetical protein